MVRHVEDSLALLAAVDAELAPSGGLLAPATGARARPLVADIGSGAGFPGLVMAIARPEWDFVLIEAVRKARCGGAAAAAA